MSNPLENMDSSGDSDSSMSEGKAIYPPCAIIDQYMKIARASCESEDNLLLGALLPVCGGVLGRRVWFEFGTRLYPNIYTMLAAKAGFRKSTCVRMVSKIASRILSKDRFLSSQASEEALFCEYDDKNGGCCDKILIEDEGNTIIANWSNSQYGKVVSKRFLSLYDCGCWRQSFKQNLKEGDSVIREIEETSTSVLIAATLGVAGFRELESKDGLQRRFLTYLSERLARTLYFPLSVSGREFEDLCMNLSTLDRLSGRLKLSEEALGRWVSIQDRNRSEIQDCNLDQSSDSEMRGSALATEPTHTLKVATIFACLRRIPFVSANSAAPTIDHLDLHHANMHVRQCIRDSMALESVSERSAIREDAERVYAIIQADCIHSECFHDENGKYIRRSKTQLTSKFANDPRRGGITTDRLYYKIVPELIRQGRCIELEQTGRSRIYGFPVEE